MYEKPNYGENASMGRVEDPSCERGDHPRTMPGGKASATMRAVEPPQRPTVCKVADLTNDLHDRLSMLEDNLRVVHSRIGASHGPEAMCEPGIEEQAGPVDYAAEKLLAAMTRIDNFRIIVETISARI